MVWKKIDRFCWLNKHFCTNIYFIIYFIYSFGCSPIAWIQSIIIKKSYYIIKWIFIRNQCMHCSHKKNQIQISKWNKANVIMYVGYFIHSFVHFSSHSFILAAFSPVHLFWYRQQAFKLHSIVVVWSWIHTVPLSSSTDIMTFMVQNLNMHFA